MTSMAANSGRSNTGWLLALAACGLLTVTAIVLAHQLRLAGKARTAMFVTITTAIGWAATAAYLPRWPLPRRRRRSTRPRRAGPAARRLQRRGGNRRDLPHDHRRRDRLHRARRRPRPVGDRLQGCGRADRDRWRGNVADDGRSAHAAAGARCVAARRRTRPGRPQPKADRRSALFLDRASGGIGSRADATCVPQQSSSWRDARCSPRRRSSFTR